LDADTLGPDKPGFVDDDVEAPVGMVAGDQAADRLPSAVGYASIPYCAICLFQIMRID
jgi:hypothetical protein